MTDKNIFRENDLTHFLYTSGKWLLLEVVLYLPFRENDYFYISGKCRDALSIYRLGRNNEIIILFSYRHIYRT